MKSTATTIKSALEYLDVNLEQELTRYRHWRATGKTYSLTDLAPEFKPEPHPPQTNPYLNLETPTLEAQSEPPVTQPTPASQPEPKLESTDQVLQNFTQQPITIKSSGFSLGSPLGIFVLLLLCGVSSLLGYLLIDRLIPKLNPTPTAPAPASPQSSWGTSDFGSPQVPGTSLPAPSASSTPAKPQANLPALPPLDSGLNSIRAMLKNSAVPNVPGQPAVSVRPYPGLPSLPPPPAQMSAAPIVRANTAVSSSVSGSDKSNNRITGEIDSSIKLIRDLAAPELPKVVPQSELVNPQVNPPINFPRPDNQPASRPVNPPVNSPRLDNQPVAANRPAPLPANPIENAPVRYAPLVTAKSQPSPTEETRYAIMAPNRYLAEGKQVEKGAFVRSSDGQVQLGSFRDPEAAQRRIEELSQQGIPVDAMRVEAR